MQGLARRDPPVDNRAQCNTQDCPCQSKGFLRLEIMCLDSFHPGAPHGFSNTLPRASCLAPSDAVPACFNDYVKKNAPS